MKLHRWADIKHKKGMTAADVAEGNRIRDEIVEEQVTLRRLRELLGLTQEELAEKLEASQSRISALEAGSDRKISTVRNYVEALGGTLRLQAVFKDGKVLELSA